MTVVRNAQALAGAKNGSRKMRLYSAEERTMFSPPPSHPPEAEFANVARSLPVSRAQLNPRERLETFDRTSPSVTPGTGEAEADGAFDLVRAQVELGPQELLQHRALNHRALIPSLCDRRREPF